MIKQWLTKSAGTKWTGSGELWLDPQGNIAEKYSCKLTVEIDAISYAWSYEDETKNGSFIFNGSGAVWIDNWHQQESTQCDNVPDAAGIFAVHHTYDVPNTPSWGWKSQLSQRPDGDLVLQMTNIAPWGETGRAVRMVFKSEQV